MKMRKTPQRTCIVTKEKTDKKNLLRIVRTTDGNVVVDETGKLNGRGCYITKDLSVLELAQKGHHIDRALEVKTNDELYKEIRKIIEK